jgi:hypothetical protein
MSSLPWTTDNRNRLVESSLVSVWRTRRLLEGNRRIIVVTMRAVQDWSIRHPTGATSPKSEYRRRRRHSSTDWSYKYKVVITGQDWAIPNDAISTMALNGVLIRRLITPQTESYGSNLKADDISTQVLQYSWNNHNFSPHHRLYSNEYSKGCIWIRGCKRDLCKELWWEATPSSRPPRAYVFCLRENHVNIYLLVY